jgi:hypothetical protein
VKVTGKKRVFLHTAAMWKKDSLSVLLIDLKKANDYRYAAGLNRRSLRCATASVSHPMIAAPMIFPTVSHSTA